MANLLRVYLDIYEFGHAEFIRSQRALHQLGTRQDVLARMEAVSKTAE